MTLQQLQYYVAVCKHQSLTRAARELSVSQPGLSTSIRDLERECGFPLFDHRPNSISLTDQGRAFLREAEHLLRSYGQLWKNAELIAQRKAVLRVGVAPMGASLLFPRLRKGFYAACPDVTFEVTEDSTETLYQKIDTGELDFALTVSIAPPGVDYCSVILGHSRLLFCVHRDHSLAEERVDTLSQVGQTPLIMLSDRYSQTKYLKRLFRAADYTPNVIQYTSQVFTILQHIRENAAAGFLSEDIVQREDSLTGFALREVEEASVTVIWRKDAQVFPAMEALIHYVRIEK
ncbi:LysR family transcriptional regulator [Anaerotruncus sp. 1XD42-93]|uniref:LysR family transcriptional regulator n=1 Tax=Anaerotruncus sp. 1XD42-93 TaxID=2320853 RepID=UPI000EA24927|nr:LysR family transcriptional regulator [Anaerotruncus sp. 1XD42-93]NBK19967.1 LysR family transcriptional regulator [Anaerotruncus sp. 1XD42-93]RKJ76594.1 LysR family transcriptional regulator [Anaerotruncus sp. 1XD22-93]